MAFAAATGVVCKLAQPGCCVRDVEGHVAPAMVSKVAWINQAVLRIGEQELCGQTVRVAMTGSKGARIAAALPRGVNSSVVCQTVAERVQQQASATTTDDVVQQETIISSSLASRWGEIQGANDWDGLLDPLDMDLRLELIRYGEFAQSCYDAFDNLPHSKYMGSCLYRKEKMLEKVGLPDTGYEITDYLFATTSVESFLLRNEAEDAWSRSSNWIGYVAVCTDEQKVAAMGRRDIVIAWRGTATKLEWAANLARSLVPYSLVECQEPAWNRKVLVEEGFLNMYTTKNSRTRYNRASVRDQILTELRRLIDKYDGETLSITVTGHSLGGAMSVLTAYDIVMSGVNRRGAVDAPASSDPCQPNDSATIPVTAFTFASPRVGNNPFADKVRELGIKVLRVANVHDVVPRVPSIFFNEDFTMFNNILDKFPWTYSHVGEEIQLDHDLSPELRKRGNPVNAHNMEAYLHLLTGYHGPGKEFSQCVDRDLALINKSSDFISTKTYGIPSNWWQPLNKGLVRNEKGKWVQAEREYEDIPDHLSLKNSDDVTPLLS